MENYSINEICQHDLAVLKVKAVTCNCETTVLVCVQCGEELSEPITEC